MGELGRGEGCWRPSVDACGDHVPERSSEGACPLPWLGAAFLLSVIIFSSLLE